MTTYRILPHAVVFALVALADVGAQPAAPAPAVQQTAGAAGTDARWTPWLGCWRATNDAAGSGARVCVTASGRSVTFRTIVAGQLLSAESRVADGAPHPVRETGCSGTETAHWSVDGRRAYRTAEAACGAESQRTLASVSFFVPGPVWVDVQTVIHDGTTSVRVSRYARASNQRLPDGTVVPQPPAGRVEPLVSRGWTTDEVVEASRVLPPDGVQAAIGEGPTAFRLNAASLVHLADGGVAEGVIDLVVALTYPEKFVVDRSSSQLGWSMGPGMETGWADPFFAQIVGPAALYNCSSPYGWAMASYWSGCSGYDSFRYQYSPGYYNGYYGISNGGWITTQGPVTEAPPQAEGRLVNGRGYTQVRPVDTSIGGPSADGRSGGTSSGTSSNGGTSSGGATSSGYSGGGGGGGGGGNRMAVPRPPGT